MEEKLLRELIAKNYFTQGTEVDAKYEAVDMSGKARRQFEGTYTVTRLMENRKTGKLIINLSSIRDGTMVKVPAESIFGIDGMTPTRFAENYMIAPDGGEIKLVGKRRGRRPKNWVSPDEE